jgi:hypothetical protein
MWPTLVCPAHLESRGHAIPIEAPAQHSAKFDQRHPLASGSPGKAGRSLLALLRILWMGAAMSDYREKAEECLRAAEKMRNPAERIEMLGIARNYMALADHAGRRQVNLSQTKRLPLPRYGFSLHGGP